MELSEFYKHWVYINLNASIFQICNVDTRTLTSFHSSFSFLYHPLSKLLTSQIAEVPPVFGMVPFKRICSLYTGESGYI